MVHSEIRLVNFDVWLVPFEAWLVLSALFQLWGWPVNNSAKSEKISKAIIRLHDVTLRTLNGINLPAQSMPTRRQWNQDETGKMTVGSTPTSHALRSGVGEFVVAIFQPPSKSWHLSCDRGVLWNINNYFTKSNPHLQLGGGNIPRFEQIWIDIESYSCNHKDCMVTTTRDTSNFDIISQLV